MCRGIVVLGLATPHDELLQAFGVAAPFKCVKGFAVGRTIFEDVASEGLRCVIDERDACEVMASRLGALVSSRLALKARGSAS